MTNKIIQKNVKRKNVRKKRSAERANAKKKKILFRAICIVLAALAALAVLTLALGKISEKTAEDGKKKRQEQKVKKENELANSYSFYEPAPGEDILGDPEYKEKIRDITYYDGYGNGVLISDGDFISRGGIGLQFLAYYFKAVREGDEQTLNKLFSEEYISENGSYKPFRPQRIYDIEVENKGEEKDEKSGNITYVYTVSYKILKNDGTFRKDIGSDMSRKQYFTVLDNGADLYITSIVEVKRLFG